MDGWMQAMQFHIPIYISSWPALGQLDLVSNREYLFRNRHSVFYALDFSTPFWQLLKMHPSILKYTCSVTVPLFLNHASFRPAHALVHGTASHFMWLLISYRGNVTRQNILVTPALTAL
jgi:hypothetical protein